DAVLPADIGKVYARKYRIRVKTEKDIAAIRRAGRLVVETLDLVAPRIQPGITTDDINTWVHEFTLKTGRCRRRSTTTATPRASACRSTRSSATASRGSACSRTATS
ncbi:MAG TPA: hypothetical protein VFX82_12000, partial [Desulfobacterales bacterium]|nr:hypothetical protein [Desulfobacterales bacterium]